MAYSQIETPQSSNLKSFGYDSDTNDFTVTFKNNNKYVYSGVTNELFEAMKKAPSVGKFFIENIKNKGYNFKRTN